MARRILGAAAAAVLAVSPAYAGSRVIVSTTLNATLNFFDAETLEETQPPLVGKGHSPVRLWVQYGFEGFTDRPMLFAANHGAAEGSVGVYDLSDDLVVEMPLSPFLARPGTVSVSAGLVNVKGYPEPIPLVFATNAWQALGGCGLPNGSVSVYDASLIDPSGMLLEVGNVETSGAIPYAVAIAEQEGKAFVAVNCGGGRLDTIELHHNEISAGLGHTEVATDGPVAVEHGGARPLDAGSDGTLFDQARGRSYTVNIGGGTMVVYDVSSPDRLTTVPLKLSDDPESSARPIEANFADTPAGLPLLVVANGGDDSISLVDRDVIESCITAGEATCGRAEIGRIATIDGGSPEGIDYDPNTNRVFVVNKPILSPSLSVVQLTETTDAETGAVTVTGEEIEVIPLNVGGTSTPLPSLIAFDVAVQVR